MIVLILAAGKGTRMKSDLPKVLHLVAGKPMINYSVDTAKKLNPSKIITVIGSGAAQVRESLGEDLTYCVQEEQKGTADAVLAAKHELERHMDDSILILCGDMPNLEQPTIEEFIKQADDSVPNFISVKSSDAKGYGRVIRAIDKTVIKIVEEKDATPIEKNINEINTGIYYCQVKELLSRLEKIDNNNVQKEYYLTDIVRNGSKAWCAKDEKEFLGVNNRVQLSELSKHIWKKRAVKYMEEGVSIISPDDVYIDEGIEIDSDVTIYPNVYIEGKSKIGKGSVIHAGNRISDSIIGENNIIKDNNLIESSVIGNNCKVGPMAHFRPGSKLCGYNNIGNFVELKKAVIGKGSKAGHLTYLGDCTLGENVNVGCGTITCNYDGFNKYETIIGDNVFVGSDVQFVAPINVGNGAIIAAGTTVTKNIPENAMVIARTPQKNLEGKAEYFRNMKKK